MRTRIEVPLGDALPCPADVLRGQGIPRSVAPDDRTSRLAEQAISRYAELARPAAVLLEITRDEFVPIFEGQGLNEEGSPVHPISQASDDLALYAVTVGEEVCAEISRLFGSDEFALGAMLDSAASEGTEMAAQAVENAYRRHLRKAGRLGADHGTLRFSPGYCGWHVTAQQALFRALRPGDVGIDLNPSCLMRPIKSTSGVILAGCKRIFEFDDDFPFCAECATHECRDRIRALHHPQVEETHGDHPGDLGKSAARRRR